MQYIQKVFKPSFFTFYYVAALKEQSVLWSFKSALRQRPEKCLSCLDSVNMLSLGVTESLVSHIAQKNM